MINIYTDGGARGNPGSSAVGVYATDEENRKIFAFGKTIGFGTNNRAEYQAVIEALSFLVENKKMLINQKEINFYMDSNLVYSQLSGLYRIKDSKLREMLFQIRGLEEKLNLPIKYSYIPREKNKEADRLVNQALDGKI